LSRPRPSAPGFPETYIEPVTPTDAWSDYWRTSRTGAIDVRAADPVADALRQHWQAQAPWLAGCQVVADIGSGPAVLPRLLLGMQPRRLSHVQWVCLDQARVPAGPDIPSTVLLRDQEDFVTCAPAAAPVDALISSFGIEYVEAHAVAVSCARWLRTGGRLHAVVHASDSVIDRVSRNSAEDILWALDEVRLFEVAHDLFTAMACLPTDPIERMMHGVQARDGYNVAVNCIKQRMNLRGSVSPALMDMLNGIRALADTVMQGRLALARQSLAMRKDALLGEVRRLQAMQRCALDARGLQELGRDLGEAGFEGVAHSAIDCALGRVGWSLSAQRR
jgi:hypothetical protein